MRLELEVTHIEVFNFEKFVHHFRKTIYRNYTPQIGMFIKLEPYIFQVDEIWDDGAMFANKFRLKEKNTILTSEEFYNESKQLKQSGFEEYDPSQRGLQTKEAGADYTRT